MGSGGPLQEEGEVVHRTPHPPPGTRHPGVGASVYAPRVPETTQTEERPQHDYNEVYYSLRAPRVAIVFPADTPHWDYFARRALWQANQLWGGAGFVLVPHHDGVVSDVVLRAVAAYDPDYVVSHRVSWKELFTAYPAARDMFVGPDGKPVTLGLPGLDESETDAASDPRTSAARDQVALVCQGYRRLDATDPVPEPDPKKFVRWCQTWHDADESKTTLHDSHHLTATTVFGDDNGMCVAAPPDLGGPWGAWTAALVGVVAKPDLPAAEPPATPRSRAKSSRPTPALRTPSLPTMQRS